MTDTIKCLVIDDESAFIKSVRSIIGLAPENKLELIGEARSVEEAVDKIDELEPDLIFLDIQLPDGTGFDVLNRSNRKDFKTIFITAFDQYAVDAFKYSAVDYLLKPVASRDFWVAVDKVRQELSKDDRELQINVLIDNLKEIQGERKKIILREGENMHIIQVKDILWCEAKGSYTVFHLENKEEILVSHHLKDYETPLSNSGFVRTHRSYLVNVSKIKRFDKSEGGSIYLEDGTQIPVSYRKKDQILRVIEGL